MLKDSSLQHFSLRVSLPLKLSHLSNALPVFSYDAIIGHLRVIFHSHANKTHFHKKGCVPSLILKVRVFGTRRLRV